MPYVNTYVDADDILDELSDDELIDELKRRGNDYNTQFVDGDEMRMVLQTLYEKRRLGKDYQAELEQLIYGILGKVI
jgi:hypothetical protein